MRKQLSETSENAVIYAKKTLAVENLFTNSENFRFTQAYLNGTMSSKQAIAEMKKYLQSKNVSR